MIKLMFLIILLLTAGYLFLPYITSLINYVSFGLGKILFLIEDIISIIFTFLTSFTRYQYLMTMLAIFICLRMIFYVIDILKGGV